MSDQQRQITLYQNGDWYEARSADANKLAEVCNLTVTRKGDMPMSFFMWQQLAKHIYLLLEDDITVVIKNYEPTNT